MDNTNGRFSGARHAWETIWRTKISSRRGRNCILVRTGRNDCTAVNAQKPKVNKITESGKPYTRLWNAKNVLYRYYGSVLMRIPNKWFPRDDCAPPGAGGINGLNGNYVSFIYHANSHSHTPTHKCEQRSVVENRISSRFRFCGGHFSSRAWRKDKRRAR